MSNRLLHRDADYRRPLGELIDAARDWAQSAEDRAWPLRRSETRRLLALIRTPNPRNKPTRRRNPETGQIMRTPK